MTRAVAFEAPPPPFSTVVKGYFCICPVTTMQVLSHVMLQSIRVVKDTFELAAC